MEEGERRSRSQRGNLFWVLLLVVVALLWWWWRGAVVFEGRSSGVSEQEEGDPDDILVDLRDDLPEGGVAALEAAIGIDLELVSSESKDERLYRAHVPPQNRDGILSALSRRAEVEVAEPDAEYRIVDVPDPKWEGFPNDPQYQYQWHLRQIGMPDAWKLADGDGVVVAVIDTGVAYEDHGRFHRVADLAGTRVTTGFNFVANTPHANDDHGHGTHVAGTIAQSTHNGVGVAGVARGATIMPLKVLSASGSGSVGAIADAVRFAADKGAKVINMSLGGRFSSKILQRAVRYAVDKGVVVVCAAGNDGRGRISYPAAYPGALAVAATQYDETTTFYSNWGKELDIAAPGGNTQVDQNQDGRPDGVLQNTIYVGDPTREDYFAFMGTSMASPHVAGVAALLISQGVTDPTAVEKILKATARPPKGRALDSARYGAGIVDAPAALTAARRNHGAWQLGLGLIVAGAIVSHARRRAYLGCTVGPSYLAGVLIGSSGLFFLPFLGDLGATLASWPGVDLLTHGLPSWDLHLFGPSSHGNALFFSGLLPLGVIALGYGFSRLRAPLAGLAAGVAAHLLFHLVVRTADIQWIPSVLDPIWLALNAIACAWLSFLVLRD
ncbi:MAG: peptidase S8 [Deltaproteobacteria bacterium]|nr:peptidase S8 [Deltaproteobacteria bacterium]